MPWSEDPGGLREGQILSTTGRLHLIGAEPDGDYHVQISVAAGSGNHCLIVEVPKAEPAYVADATLHPRLEVVREFMRTRLLRGREPSQNGSVMQHPPCVKVSGQLFFDDWHVTDANPRGKKGMKAATLWELHPVTAIAFTRNCAQ